MITGKDLIVLGHKPGAWFKEAINIINTHKLEGEAMLAYIEKVKPVIPEMIPLQKSVPYFENIKAENEVEQQNLDSVRASMDLISTTPTIRGSVIMPDACPSGPLGQIPVGGVIASYKSLHPSWHSADVCCSLMLTDLGKVDPKTALDIAMKVTHFGPGGRSSSNHFRLPEEIMEEFKTNSFLNSEKSIRMAKEHLGTQGASNHFLSINLNSIGSVTLTTHHGSRGVGALLFKRGMEVAEKFRKNISEKTLPSNAWIPSDTKEGEEYWKALQIVRLWTKQNHIVIHDEICKRLKITPVNRFWNEHNFVFQEGDLFYHAKGATPVNTNFLQDLGGPQIIPLNMSEPILLVEGGTTETNLGFAPHGSGRNYSRSEHRRNNSHKTPEQMLKDETANIDIRFYSGEPDLSELPSAYKNADQVKQQIKDFNLATVVEELTPFGGIMAGKANEPWRDRKKKK